MNLYVVGEIVAAHGIRGEIRVYPVTSFPERFLNMEEILIGKNENAKSYKIKSARTHKNIVVLSLDEIKNRDEAEKLIGDLLYVAENDLYKLPEDHYYIFDLIGLTVYDEKWGALGIIKDVIESPQDLYVIEPIKGSPAEKSFYIPAVKAFIKNIDLPAKMMSVDLPEGLWDQ